MALLCVLVGAFAWFIANVFTANIDHDLFEKQAHLYELGVQIQRMHERLYANCPHVFQTPDSSSVAIFGRRRSVDLSLSSLDLKIDLAEEALGKLMMKYRNCTSQTSITTVSTSSQTPTTIIPTSAQPTTSIFVQTTTQRHQHAFQVLRSRNITYKGYNFLALEVRIPVDGLSRRSNWCYDYQYLCEDFQRRPTGCGNYWIQYYSNCRDIYNSDMSIDGDVLSCHPADRIANLSNIAFPNLNPPAHVGNAFGFFQCSHCNKTLYGSGSALKSVADFWISHRTKFYTVCH